MEATNRSTAYVTLLSLLMSAAFSGANARTRTRPPAVDALLASLEPYSSLALAKNAETTAALTDCVSDGDLGAMGVHFGNPALIDDVVNERNPEALVHEPGTNGEMSLVGVEFVVPFSLVAQSAPAPVLFGHAFTANEVFGLWALHVWTHRANPVGLFAPWNPQGHC